ncbi:MAG: IS4 family transposase [Thermoplasmata archaeon]|nr:IS4 family transposase [Thermoplasmata archaeon]
MTRRKPESELRYHRTHPLPTPLGRTAVQESLDQLLPADTIRQFARESRFVVRERTIDPVVFLWTLVLDFGVELHRFLEELRYAYVKSSELEDLAYPSYYLRFNAELCEFLRLCLQQAIAQLPREPGRELDPRLRAFVQDVVIKDSSVVRLHASLATKWPATRSRKVAAGVKVDLLVSVCANGPKSVALVGERTHDVKLLRLGGWVKDRILLADLGYYSHRLFAKIEEHGGYFVSRWKKSAYPLFVGSLKVHRGRAIDLEGKRLSEVLPKLQREVLDAEVELTFQRPVYAGHRSLDTFRCRLVAVWDERHGEYHTYLTNIPIERLTAEEVAQLYSLRWEIELTFKELKSHYALDKFRTTKAIVVEALIWSALLTLVASRQIHNLVRRIQPPELRPRYPALKWARVFRGTARDILRALLGYLGLGKGGPELYRAINTSLTRMALDSHIKRHRLREDWSRAASLN